MKTIFLASECAPIVKVGGLGDVAGALPKALKKLGVDVSICLPFYKTIDKSKYALQLVRKDLRVFYEEREHGVDVYKTTLPGSDMSVYLFENRFYLSGGGVYFSASAFCEAFREIERFSFFSKAVLEFLKAENIKIDVFHCNDWHTASIPILLKTLYKDEPVFRDSAVVYTIHNLGNQGVADLVVLDELGIQKESLQSLDWDAQNRDIDLMMEGIIQSDVINAVSPTYAKEILTYEYGQKLEGVLRGKSGRVFGIINGIDYDIFDPGKDKGLFFQYGLDNWMEGKKKNKEALQKALGLEGNDKPLIGMVTRLTKQKGLDLIKKIFDQMIKLDVQFVAVGLGEPAFEKAFTKFAKEYPGVVSVNLKFNLALASQIYAASDIFLMPSKFEPCGLGQLIALKYGSVPVVRATGGLKDTIRDKETGFVFEAYKPQVLLETLTYARDLYKQKDVWKKMVEAGMKEEFSWGRSAKEYIQLYQKALEYKHGK